MDVSLLDPADAAAIEIATGALFDIMRRSFEEGLDVDVQVVHRIAGAPGGRYVVVVHVLAGERVVEDVELAADPAELADHTRLRLLRLHVDALLRRHDRWRLDMNRRLVALGLAKLPGSRP